ncbi:MAG TPA: hypothetical protein VMD48_06805 [Solirubrobacteraceae bacterium]|nr:hypothetical protein [Solirubrobacteraceae bacterium]
MLTLVLAVVSSNLGVFIPVLVAGVVIGVFGHIIKSNWLIILGILIIGLVSAYFSFVLQPGSG